MTKHSTSTSSAVVQALAAHKGVDGTDIMPRLYDILDPDALNELFQGERNADAPAVSFTYSGCRVRITGPTDIEIQEIA